MNDAKYMRNYRAEHPDYTDRESRRAKATRRAVAALIALHRLDYEQIYKTELERAQVIPGRSGRPQRTVP